MSFFLCPHGALSAVLHGAATPLLPAACAGRKRGSVRAMAPSSPIVCIRALLIAALLPATAGNMYDVIDAVDAFVAPPECPLGCMNWTAALNVSEQAATFADPSRLPSLGARCAIPGNALRNTFPGRPGTSLSALEKAAFYGPICPCRSSAASSTVEYHTCT